MSTRLCGRTAVCARLQTARCEATGMPDWDVVGLIGLPCVAPLLAPLLALRRWGWRQALVTLGFALAAGLLALVLVGTGAYQYAYRRVVPPPRLGSPGVALFYGFVALFAFWAGSAGAVLGGMLYVAVLSQRERRRGEPRCRRCGYNLRGLPEPRCPECGTPF